MKRPVLILMNDMNKLYSPKLHKMIMSIWNMINLFYNRHDKRSGIFIWPEKSHVHVTSCPCNLSFLVCNKKAHYAGRCSTFTNAAMLVGALDSLTLLCW